MSNSFFASDLLNIIATPPTISQEINEDTGELITLPIPAFVKNVLERKGGGCFSSNAYLTNESLREIFNQFKAAEFTQSEDTERNKLLRLFVFSDISANNADSDSSTIVKQSKTLQTGKTSSAFMLYSVLGSSSTYEDSRNVAAFLNSMPATAVSSMVPYVDAEFEFKYNKKTLDDGKSRPPGMLRFLLGPSRNDTSNVGKLLDESLVVRDTEGNHDYGYAGMEIFTSPITLTNPKVSSRYVDILDPFVPLASLTGLSVKFQGTKGFYSHKTGTLELTVHNRSRLIELAEIIQPQYFSGTTLWLTYGWRYKNYTEYQINDPFSRFVNGNMLIKEAFTIANSSFSFEGNTVKITLTISTKGYNELANFKITNIGTVNTSSDLTTFGNIPLTPEILNVYQPQLPPGQVATFGTLFKAAQDLSSTVTSQITSRGLSDDQDAKKALNILGSGVLTSAVQNSSFPDIDNQKVLMDELNLLERNIAGLNGKGVVNYPSFQNILAALREVYSSKPAKDKGRYVYKDKFQKIVTKQIAEKFAEIFSIEKGVEDRYLHKDYRNLNEDFVKEVSKGNEPQQKQPKKASPSTSNNVVAFDKGWTYDYQINGWYNPTQKNTKGTGGKVKNASAISEYESKLNAETPSLNRRYVSYGLIFERLIMMSALAQTTINDVQVFYGQLSKDSATAGQFGTANVGASSPLNKGMSLPLNIAEFPVDAYIFLEKYKKTVIDKGTEQLTLGEMLEILNYQISDPRAVPYGFRGFYKPFDAEKPEVEFTNDDIKRKAELVLNGWKPPQVGVSIETLQLDDNFRLNQNEDLLRLYESSAKEKRLAGKNNTQVMRIKVFDRNNTKSFIEQLASPNQITSISSDQATDAQGVIDSLNEQLINHGFSDIQVKTVETSESNKPQGFVLNFGSNKVVKDFFSTKIPTIIIGANNSNIINSSVSTNMDARLTTSLIMQGSEGNSPGEPLGLNLRGLPVNVQPGAVNLTILGCPIINYMQGFFIDFGTGTSVDNSYYVVDVNHQFNPGKFQTTLKLAFSDSITPYRNPRSVDGLIAALKGTTNFNFTVT